MKKIFSLFAAVLMAGSMMAGVLVEYNGTATLPAGVTISGTTKMANVKIHTNTDGVDCIQLANGYTTDGLFNGNAITLHNVGGFKAGDTLKVAGFFNNADDTKVAKAEVFTVNAELGCTAVWTSNQFVNGRLVNDEPVLEAYVLVADMDSIMIGRNGGTGANLKYIAVVRPEAAPVVDPVTVTVDYSTKSYENGQEVAKVDLDEVVSVTFDKGTNSNAPKYYTTGTAIRCYGGNTFTVSAKNANLTNIALTFSSGEGTNDITASVGTYADGTWTGEANEVVFTIGGTSGHRRIATMAVTYVATEAPAVEAPVFSVAAGSYYDAQTVELSCETEGAEIRYTLDGTEPTATSTLYNTALTISETTTVKAVAVKDANVSEVVSKTYEIAVAYASFDELVSKAGTPAGQKVVVNFENVVIDSLYTSKAGKVNGVYLTAGGRMVEIYCYDVPATWEVGGTISGTVKGEWKDFNGTWEVCPSSWEGITYAAPVVTKYYFKHPWNGGDWTWKEAADTTFLGIEASYVVAQWGDHGFNFHTAAEDKGSTWYEKEVIGTITPDGTPAIGYPAKGTEVTFICLHEDHTHAVGGGRAWIVYAPATAIENTTDVKAVKVIENGQVVIIKNGVRYNAIGAKL